MIDANKKVNILSIEDDDFMQIFLKDVFWMHGTHKNFVLHQVNNIASARKFLSDSKNMPDLIFLDIRLPENESEGAKKDTGLAFVKELRQDPALKNTKIVIFSGFSDQELQDEALKLGADKFLIKGEHLPMELVQITEDILYNR